MLLLVSWILVYLEWLLWEIRHSVYDTRHWIILWGICQYKCHLSRYTDFYYKQKAVINLYNGYFVTVEMASLYWDSPQILIMHIGSEIKYFHLVQNFANIMIMWMCCRISDIQCHNWIVLWHLDLSFMLEDMACFFCEINWCKKFLRFISA